MSVSKSLFPLSSLLLISLVSASPSWAGAILSPVAVIHNGIGNYAGFVGFPETTDETPMFNQSGLSAHFTSGVTGFGDFIGLNPTHNPGSPEIGNGWISPAYCPCTGAIDFDLGGVYSIEQMALWNMASNSEANVESIRLYTSLTADFSTAEYAGDFINPQMDSGTEDQLPYPATVFDLADSVGRYVRLEINSYYGAYFVSEIGELAFDVAPAPTNVPLPGAGLLFLAGLTVMGGCRPSSNPLLSRA